MQVCIHVHVCVLRISVLCACALHQFCELRMHAYVYGSMRPCVCASVCV